MRNLAQHELEHELMGFDGGGGGTVPVATGLWSERPEPSAAAGSRYVATDLAETPLEFRSDGENYRPASGAANLFLMTWSYGIAPSGTISAGATGHLTIATAFQHTYSEGMWLYLGAAADAVPALAAGWYWVVMSSTTVGTIYTNGPGSAAFNFSAPGSYSGVTAAIRIPFSYTVKAGLMPPKALLEISGMILQSNATGAKTGAVYFGGQPALSTSNGSFYRRNLKGQITNKGVRNKQVASSWVADAGTSASIGTAVDTAADTVLEFELKTPDPAQYVIFDHLRCTLFT